MEAETKVFEYKFEIFNKGEFEELTLKIKFINHEVLEQYANLKSIQEDIEDIWEDCKAIIEEEITTANSELENKRVRLKELRKERREKEREIKRLANDEYFTRRLEIISNILTSNNITDERLFKADFWRKYVSPEQMQDFLAKVVYKDYDDKVLKKKSQKMLFSKKNY